jgi:hypothetical protein
MARAKIILSLMALFSLFVSSFAVSAKSLEPVEPEGTFTRQAATSPSNYGSQKPGYATGFPRPNRSQAAPNAVQASLGQPGTSYRYTETFGETEIAYISDTTHINYPWGLGTDGANVWIGELWGNRGLKYTSTGSFQMQIGLSGFADIYDTVLWEITDVAVDNSGNTWIVDGGANHLVKFDAAGNKIGELGSGWGPGTGNDRFDQPQSIANDAGGNLYVSDGAPWHDASGGNHRIQIFDSLGNYLATIGQTGICGIGNDQLCGPRHITVYGNLLYVTDSGNQRVQIFNISTPTAPTYVATIGVPGEEGNDNAHFSQPSGVAVDSDYIYVADTWNNRVQVFSRVTYAYVTTIGTGWGSNNDQFKNPSDVGIDATGDLFVADFVNIRVQQFSRSGSTWTYARTYGTTGVPYVTDGVHYNHPSGVVVSSAGDIYITEELGHRLVKLNANGELQWTVGAAGVKGDWDNSNDRLNNPADVALDSNGKVYVADRWHGRVQIYNSNGSYFATVGDLWCPGGVAIAPNDYLYVADSCQNTVQVYDTNLTLVATLGESGISGSDNLHFDWPEDVVIDGDGFIYVADQNNNRVQVFSSSQAYVRTLGETGVWGNEFNHFGNPVGLFMDKSNRLFVVDAGNDRVQVLDTNGAYITTIGGDWGNNTGQVQNPGGVAVDLNGNVYIADWGNHRIQKFALGTPGWRQVNINGFGERENTIMATLQSYGGQLYAGTYNYSGNGAQLWRYDGSSWSVVMENGFEDASNAGIDHLYAYNGNFYAGTWNEDSNAPNGTNGGQIWRSNDGTTWTRISLPELDASNGEIFRFAQFNGQIYATTWTYTGDHGGEIWRSASGGSGTWVQSVANGFNGDVNNIGATALEVYNNQLYAGTYNYTTGGEVWRSPSGNAGTWTQVNLDGFGAVANRGVTSLVAFDGYLYAGVDSHDTGTGAEIWRCQECDGNDWVKVMNGGFGDPNTRIYHSMVVMGDTLYSIVGNVVTGMIVYRSKNGITWNQVGFDGFGDSNNRGGYWGNSVVVHNGTLFIGTINNANAGEIWQLLQTYYLPLVRN